MTTTPDEAIDILQRGHSAIAALLRDVPGDDLVRPGTIGGGEWSAKDLIAHMTTWEEIALRTLDEWERGERPWIEETDSDADRINAERHAEKAGRSAERVSADGERIHAELVGRLRVLSETQWAAPAPYVGGRRSLGELLGAVLGAPAGPFDHAAAHLPDVESFARNRRPT
jgi:DinB family protein